MIESQVNSHSILIQSDSKEHTLLLKKILNGVLDSPHFDVCHEHDQLLSEVKSKKFDLVIIEKEDDWLNKREELKDLNSPVVLLYGDAKCIKYFQSIEGVSLVEKKRLLIFFADELKTIFNLHEPLRLDNKVDFKTTVQYFSVKDETIKNMETIPCDIYALVGTKKYIKVGNSNEKISETSIGLYLDKGIQEFFVTNEDYYIHKDKFFPPSSVDKKLETGKSGTERALEIVRESVSDLGFTQVLLDQVDSVIENIYDTLKAEEYKGLLDTLDTSVGSYLYNHSYLTSLLACTYVKTQSWFSSEIQKKIIMGAMMHDLGFKNKDNAFYETVSKDKLEQLPKSIREDIENHSSRVIELLKKDKAITDDVLKIIRTIHLEKDETEYANSTEFSKLAVVVYLSHQVSFRLFKVAFNRKKIPQTLESVETEFSFGPFKKMINEFMKSVKTTLDNAA